MPTLCLTALCGAPALSVSSYNRKPPSLGGVPCYCVRLLLIAAATSSCRLHMCGPGIHVKRFSSTAARRFCSQPAYLIFQLLALGCESCSISCSSFVPGLQLSQLRDSVLWQVNGSMSRFVVQSHTAKKRVHGSQFSADAFVSGGSQWLVAIRAPCLAGGRVTTWMHAFGPTDQRTLSMRHFGTDETRVFVPARPW